MATTPEWVAALRGQKCAWLTVINSGYVKFLRNFVASVQRHGLPFRLLVLCLDEEALRGAQELHLPCAMFNGAVATPQLAEYGSAAYKSIVFLKLDALREALENLVGSDVEMVAYIDTDVVLLQDPTPLVLQAAAAHPQVSLFMQCDENTA